MLLYWLEKMKNNVTFFLLQTDQLVTKIDRLLTLDIHNTSAPIWRCSLHTFRFKGEKFSWKIASLLFKALVMFLNQGTISSLLEPYIEKGSVSVLNVSLWKFSKRPMWSFKPTCQQCVYVAKLRSYSWWIAVIVDFESGSCKTIRDYDDFEIGCSVVPRREIGTRRATR